MARFEIRLPKLDEIQETAIIRKIYKKIGDAVKKKEKLATIETMKVTYDIESEYEGFVEDIRFKEGEEAPVNEILMIINTEQVSIPKVEEKPIEKKEVKVEEKREEVIERKEVGEIARAMPMARRLAREKGIDLSKIKGTGPGGIITVEDVKRYLEQMQEYYVEEISVLRKQIADKMNKANTEIPTARLTIKVKMDKLLNLRKNLEEKYSKKISLTAVLTKAVAEALKRHRKINSLFVKGEWRIYNRINIAIAIQTKQGLVTPVIKDVDKKDIINISDELETLQKKAEANELSLEDVTGSTFTITNLGPYNIIQFDPIINYPQIAILAIGSIFKELEITQEGLIIHNFSYFTLAFDHRFIDGYDGALFLNELKRIIENLEF
jgi:pyruvate dehydrogenase E2 component (dihydrolipoamide acetyltransferase)